MVSTLERLGMAVFGIALLTGGAYAQSMTLELSRTGLPASPVQRVGDGVTFDIDVRVSTTGQTYSWSFAVAHDPTELELIAVDPGEDLALAFPVPGVPPAFQELTAISNPSGEGFIFALIFSTTKSFYLPAGDGLCIARATYSNLMSTTPASSTLAFVDGVLANLPSPPVSIGFSLLGGVVLDSSSPDLSIVDLTLENDLEPQFIRGDCDQSSPAIGIADVITNLQYLFSGGDEPGCLDACDTTDDGVLSIADPTSLLVYLFQGGMPPSPPFGACGSDATPDGVGCSTEPGDCL